AHATHRWTPMLSSDRPKPGVTKRPHAGVGAGGARHGAPRVNARSFGAIEPWDAESAEALTRLYESEEGDLTKPAPAEPATPAGAHGQAQAPPSEHVADAADAADRTWLESHLAHLARRLQESLVQSGPEKSIGMLSERLDAIEQRFSAALGRVARRTDLE